MNTEISITHELIRGRDFPFTPAALEEIGEPDWKSAVETNSDRSILTDIDLVRLARCGDRAAFGLLIERNYRRCMSVALAILRNREEAQDQVQTACRKAFEHLDQFRGACEFRSWLIRIVENECLMVIRSRRRASFLYIDSVECGEERASLDLPAPSLDPERELVAAQMASVVRREILRLPPLLREVILLCDIEGLEMGTITSRLGITVSAAKSRLMRARVQVRNRALKHYGRSGTKMPASAVCDLPAKSATRRNWAA